MNYDNNCRFQFLNNNTPLSCAAEASESKRTFKVGVTELTNIVII